MKKGFTLIELLAVIVILAIIATIAIPMVLNIINSAKISSVESSMKNLEKALKLYHYTNKNDNDIVFNCDDGVCKTTDGNKLNISGQLPSKGVITISKSGRITYDTVVLSGYLCDKINDEFTCNLASKNMVLSEDRSIVTNNNTSTTLNNYRIYGNSKQNTYNGLQLLDFKTLTSGYSTISTQEDGRIIKITGKDAYFQRHNDYITVTPGETVYISVKSITGGNNPLINIQYVHDSSYTSAGSLKNDTLSLTLTIPEGITKLRIALVGNFEPINLEEEITATFTELMVSRSRITSWEPYVGEFYLPNVENPQEIQGVGEYDETTGKYKIPVTVRGKNLFDINNYRTTNGSVAIKDNTITLVSSTEKKAYIVYRIPVREYAGKKIYFSANYTTNQTNAPYHNIRFRRADDTTIETYSGQSAKGKGYDLPLDVDYVSLELYGSGKLIDGTTIFTNVMVEVSDTPTNYEPYVEPTTTNIYLNEPLRKIEDYDDYIDFKSSKMIKNVGILTLNGEESWKEKNGAYYLEESLRVSDDKKISISTHFKYGEGNSSFWIDSMNRINIKNELVNNLDEFKQWLANNNVTIHYPLKKSIVKEIELPKINLDNGISVDTSLKPSKIFLDYN